MSDEQRVALITGGARGIGAATAEVFAERGISVAVCDLKEEDAQATASKLKTKSIGIGCDVSKKDQVDAMFERAARELGTVDILVCCAGVLRDNLVFKMTEEDWDIVMNTHLKGSFLCAQAAQKGMVEKKWGKIVLLSSTSALGNRGQTNYSTAKAGLQAMARTLAIELGKFNINVNAVAPGFIETAMTRQTSERMGLDFEEFKKLAAASTPLQRVGQPRDVATVIAFLCSDDSSFVTGQTLYIRGGP